MSRHVLLIDLFASDPLRLERRPRCRRPPSLQGDRSASAVQFLFRHNVILPDGWRVYCATVLDCALHIVQSSTVVPLVKQLRDAWLDSKLTLDEVIEISRLDLSRGSLSRKLSGAVPLSTSEAEQLANALGRTIAWVGGAGGSS